MPVFITDTDALDRICTVECWRMHPDAKTRFCLEQTYFDPFSFEGFRCTFDSLPEEERKETHHVLIDGNSAIYGSGGYHRYFVRGTGEIVFSEMHARDGLAVDRAKKAGFSIL